MTKRFRLAGLNALLAFMIALAGFAGTANTTSAQRTGKLSITVVDSVAGHPVAGATVSFYDGSGELMEEGSVDPDTGTFATNNEYGYTEGGFEVSAEEYVTQKGTFVNGEGSFTETVRLVAEEAGDDNGDPVSGTLSITVLDSETEAPVTDAHVVFKYHSGTVIDEGDVDEDGTFTSEQDVQEGRYTVTAPGYVAKDGMFSTAQGPFEQVVYLVTEESGPAPISGTLSITVVDSETKAPVTNAYVSFPEITEEGPVDENGTFATAAEHPFDDYNYVITAEGYQTSEGWVTNGEGDLNATIEMVPEEEPETPIATSITGKVTDADGNGIEGATVCINEIDECDTTVGTGVAGGNFSFGEVPYDTYTMTATADDYGSQTIEVSIDAPFNLVGPFVLEAGEPVTHSVTITAATSDEGSAEGASVIVEDAEGDQTIQTFFQIAQEPAATGTIGENNTVTFNLPAGGYTVTIDATTQGYGVQTVPFTVPVDDGVVTVALQPVEEPTAVPVTVGVALPDDGTAQDVGISWAIDDPFIGGAEGRMAQGSDTFDIPATLFGGDDNDVLEPGTYLVSINAVGYDQIQEEIEVTEDGDNVFVFELAVAQTPVEDVLVDVNVEAGDSGLTELPEDTMLHVLDEDGDVVTGADMSGVDLPTGNIPVTVPGDVDGTYTVMLDGVDATEATFTVADGVATPDTVTLTLAAAVEPPVETQDVTIIGETSDEGSAEGAAVIVADAATGDFVTAAIVADGELDADSAFVATDLQPGDYEVIVDATAQGYGVGTAEFTVPVDGGEVVVALDPVTDPTVGFVTLNKFYCDGLDEVVFGDDLDAVGEECVVGPATFTFYLYGDGTDEHWQIELDETGLGSIELAAGTYEVVEEGTLAKVDVDVVAGENTLLVAQNPMPAEAPGDDVDNGDTDNGDTDEADEADEEESAVSELPKTGTGQEAGSATMLMLMAAAGAVTATAGGLVVRQKRS